ncbi:MAG: threonine synthase [Hyphomicrobium sp.]|nr:threonine synthase [Hyphomicrobium sp.]
MSFLPGGGCAIVGGPLQAACGGTLSDGTIVKYISTRGAAPALGFEDVLLTGLARDGGLYLPEKWPELTREEIAGLAGQSYQDVAVRIMKPYVGGEIPDADLAAIITDAYATFRHRVVTPLVQVGPSDWILELFHGPTLAFKDVAMQVLSRLMDRALSRRGRNATIVGATSGDTGGAAIEAFRGRDAIDIFMLFPEGRVSDVQRRQMTTPTEANVHTIAIQGTFDDCQNMVKALFNDLPFRDRLGLAGVNSINWARLMAQIVYYFTSAVALGAPSRTVSYSVPTGNFGDILAGYAAKRMGLPIDRLVIATNVNDILTRMLETGRYESREVAATFSPSMDIQISSNFERLLFELTGRHADRVNSLMRDLTTRGGFALTQGEHGQLKEGFDAERTDETATLATIRDLEAATGYLADPHTAVAVSAARRVARRPDVPMITLSTAHPAKFPDAIRRAVGHVPPEPETVTRQRTLPERVTVLPNDVAAVAQFVSSRARAGRG